MGWFNSPWPFCSCPELQWTIDLLPIKLAISLACTIDRVRVLIEQWWVIKSTVPSRVVKGISSQRALNMRLPVWALCKKTSHRYTCVAINELIEVQKEKGTFLTDSSLTNPLLQTNYYTFVIYSSSELINQTQLISSVIIHITESLSVNPLVSKHKRPPKN